MIEYFHGFFGLGLLPRFHGSALWKSLLPAVISECLYVIMYYPLGIPQPPPDVLLFGHPYVFGCIIAALSFLLGFRTSFAYGRYWEAHGAVHQMHSKWIDVGVEFAAFHLQADCFDQYKPPAFGSYPNLKSTSRERERLHEKTLQEIDQDLENMGAKASMRTKVARKNKYCCTKADRDSITGNNNEGTALTQPKEEPVNGTKRRATSATPTASGNSLDNRNMMRKSGDEKGSVHIKTATKHNLQDEVPGGAWKMGQPPLFLEEAAHLLSLLSAVACSTLRNDLEEADSPLIPFTPGLPWPHVNPDDLHADVRQGWAVNSGAPFQRIWRVIKYLLGISRTSKSRTLYNAARPFRVVGGVSDAEVAMLQAARGPLAKVSLCFMWVMEFISREYLAGATGKVAPPIISRMYQFASDGMLGYNQARKTAYIPFPFPHAQITSLFVWVMVFLCPLLMVSYVNNEPLGFVVNFITVMAFAGLHEVARELENPFLNVPNDIPLNNFQAQFNESLMTMFAGYHPDAYWEVYENYGDFPSSPTSQAAVTSSSTSAAKKNE